MTMFSTIERTKKDVFQELLAGLETEFGSGDCEALAERFLDAERADFYWDGRIVQRHLGDYESFDGDQDRRFERVAITGCLKASWYVGICIIDGEGGVEELIGLRTFGTLSAARSAFADVR